MKEIIFITITVILCIRFGSSAHFIIGYVEDSGSGEPANAKEIVLWNIINSSDNLTDIIGPTGNSGVNNIYMIDCELLHTPCEVGDILSVKVQNSEPFISNTQNVTVTGAGFDIVNNISLSSPIQIENVLVEDDLTTPVNEIDLSAAGTKNITCSAVLIDVDNETEIQNVTAEFFDNTVSNFGDPDDNNTHYTNQSCWVDYSYGDTTQAFTTCNFSITYYANAANWNCTIKATDIYEYSNQSSDTTQINALLALGVNATINYGTINGSEVSDEIEVNITNYGNVEINLSLNGYGATQGDGNAMNCTNGVIPIANEKYNLTSATPGPLTVNQFNTYYESLTTNPVVRDFGLTQRINDIINNASKPTYWRIYLPNNVSDNCTGNIVFGAVEAAGI